jgi:periplasmic protein TonB
MFGNLIESGSHAADLKRKGRFLLGTTLFYALLFAVTGVGSIYAYNARLEQPDDEYILLSMMRFPPTVREEPARREETRPAASRNVNQVATRTDISINTPYRGDRIAPETAKDINPRTPVVIANYNSDLPPLSGGTGPIGPGSSTGGGEPGGPIVKDNGGDGEPPAIVKPTPAPPQRQNDPIKLSSGVLAGKAISKPAPAYPTIAKTAHIQGPVSVQVLIDEQGRVISAKATSGPALLQNAAAQAAYQARFTPTLLSGQPVKVTGVITYNFVLQ